MATTVLLVEDEVLISESVCDALTDEGFEVQVAQTADIALEYIKSGQDIDILFTDINLPGDIDGSELANHARLLRPDLPIVYCSGRFSNSDLGALVPRSIFVNKPYSMNEICTLLRRLASTQH